MSVGSTCQACLTSPLQLAVAQQRKLHGLPAAHACCALESHSCHLERMCLLLACPQTGTAQSQRKPAAPGDGWQQHLRQHKRPVQMQRARSAWAPVLRRKGAHCKAAQKTSQLLGARLAAAEQTPSLAEQQALPGWQQQQQQDCHAAAVPGQMLPRRPAKERRETELMMAQRQLVVARRAVRERQSLTVLVPAQHSKQGQQPSTCTFAHRVCIVLVCDPDAQPNELQEQSASSVRRLLQRPITLP